MRPTAAAALALLLLAPLALALGPAPASASASASCEEHVPGLGLACPVEGGYTFPGPDGRMQFTHGPDPVPDDVAPFVDLYGDLAGAPRTPPCISDPLLEYHAHFIYAHPADKPDRSAELYGALQHLIAQSNGLLHLEGAELGAPVEYRFLCDGSGLPLISVETIPVATGAGEYRALTAILTARGYANPNAKYWVWYDDPTACPCGGIAVAPGDMTRTPYNAANAGGMFAATYGYLSARILMHENGHNLAAVGDSAPDSSGAGHCNDGADIMCYNDGGPTAAYRYDVCTDRQHFDCGHDSYFHTDPPIGTYLYNRWNLGSPLNRYFQGCLHVDREVLPGTPLDVAVPEECAGHRYAVYGRGPASLAQNGNLATTTTPVAVNVFQVCWYDGETLLSCPANNKGWGHEGRVPAGADRAVMQYVSGENMRATLSVV